MVKFFKNHQIYYFCDYYLFFLNLLNAFFQQPQFSIVYLSPYNVIFFVAKCVFRRFSFY